MVALCIHVWLFHYGLSLPSLSPVLRVSADYQALFLVNTSFTHSLPVITSLLDTAILRTAESSTANITTQYTPFARTRNERKQSIGDYVASSMMGFYLVRARPPVSYLSLFLTPPLCLPPLPLSFAIAIPVFPHFQPVDRVSPVSSTANPSCLRSVPRPCFHSLPALACSPFKRSHSSRGQAIGFCMIPALQTVNVVKERETKAKQLQLIMGLSSASYWASTWMWDFMQFGLPWIGASILVYIFGPDSYKVRVRACVSLQSACVRAFAHLCMLARVRFALSVVWLLPPSPLSLL